MKEKMTIGKTGSGMSFENKSSIIRQKLGTHFAVVDAKTNRAIENREMPIVDNITDVLDSNSLKN